MDEKRHPRELKFRAWNPEEKIMGPPFTIGDFVDAYPMSDNIDTTGIIYLQWTGLKDKNGEEIYEGDRIQWRQPYRTTQTHTGDNIPNGSYTEPMEPGIRQFDGIVCFHNGAFCVENYDGPEPCELSWINIQYDLEEIQAVINSNDDMFSDPEEGDLVYLIEEIAKLKTPEELIEYLSGVEVIGNIYQSELSES